MAKAPQMTKRLAISKANAQTVAIVAAASFLTIFSIVAALAVWKQNSYELKVISYQSKANNQLKSNVQTYNQLTTSYEGFESASNNVIGGLSNGSGTNGGDNARIILDALPPSYDFPALTSTIEKILKDRGFSISGITGTDDQINQQNNTSNPNPQPVQMPFTFTVNNTNYTSISNLITSLQQSIRPIQIDSMAINGGGNTITLTVNAHTFYQPAKNLQITKQVVK